MVVFKAIRWKNLLSTGNTFTEINITSHKSSLIVGDNGAGKSTILDALSFGLYGKPFRKVNKPQLINSINGKNLEVEIEFDIGNKQYLVRRGQKPNVFEIHQNGVLINQSADSKDYQDLLERSILKMNHKSFSQIVVLGSASFIPFMQLTAAHRREIIEDLLDIQIFTTMNTLLKDKTTLNKESITNVDFGMRRTADKIEMEKKHQDLINESRVAQIEDKRAKIAGYQSELVEIQTERATWATKLAEYNELLKGLPDTRTKLSECEDQIRTLKTQSNHLGKENTFFNNHENCPTCRQLIGDSHKNDIVTNNTTTKAEIDASIVDLQAKKEKIETRIEKYDKVTQKANGATQSIAALDIRSATTTRFVQSIELEIEQLSAPPQVTDTQSDLQKLKEELKGLLKDKTDLVDQKRVLDVASTLLKDGGIKTKIIKQYVPIINKLINKYLAAMDFFVNFELNENFEEKIKSRFRDEFSYASFSEGEKSRLDLALLFTWRAVAKLRNSASTNLLILDEVFDGSLDNTGNDELLKILQTLTAGNNVFVISHKTDAFLDKFERVLKFEKHKNFSRIVDV